jgi:hypothetical protein
MKDAIETTDWKVLCEFASREQDPAKLLALITRINRALEDYRRKGQQYDAATT